MTRDGVAVVVLPVEHGRIELRMIDGGTLIGRITLAHREIRSLVEQLELVSARVAAGRYAASEPLERGALK